MIENYAPLSYIQLQPGEAHFSYGEHSTGDGKDDDRYARKSLTFESYIQHDKEALARLLKMAAADAETSGQPVDLYTGEELLRLIPVLCAYFSREELLELVGERLTGTMLDLHRIEAMQNLFLEHELHNVLRAFNEARIPLLLIKGPVLAYTVYPDAHMRTYHDIDGFVHLADMHRAHDLLIEMGFSFYEEFRANTIDRKRTGYNYVLERPNSWLKVFIELHSAPHPSEIGTTFDIEALWARAQSISILDEPALTLDPVDHLLYLCWHYRFHGFTRLLWLYDIVMMVRAVGSDLDWEQVIFRARQQRLAATLYYCLSWCRDLFEVAIPEGVFDHLQPPSLCRLIVERLAMPRPLEALALPRGQERRILAHRAMVDSSLELFGAGLRMLFPVPSVLGRRYMNNSRLPLQFVFVFYLVHPWITLAKGCRYLLKRGEASQPKRGTRQL